MTETKWTPGPHRVIFGAGDWGMPTSHYILRPGAKDEYDQNGQIALLPFIQPYCIGSSRGERQLAVEQRANAQLYAAAPDLYAATDWVERVPAWEFGDDVHEDSEVPVFLTAGEIRALIDARRKARDE